MINRAPVRISGASPPIVTTSAALVANLNADLLDGYHASAFAPSSHEHEAADVTSGVFAAARIGSGIASSNRALFAAPGGGTGEWRNISAYDVTDLTDYGIGLAQTLDAAAARAYLGAASSSHAHVVGEVAGAAGVSASTVNRIPYWSGPGVLGDSPLVVGGDSVTTDMDFGTNGTVTCSDLVVNYDAATSLKSSIYNKVKSVVQGSSSVTVTPNDGLQTLTLTASPGSSLPAVPAGDATYVLVRSGGVLSWLPLIGTA